MENNFLNQNVEVLVSFAGAFRDSGYSPVAYVGQLIGVDDNYIMVNVSSAEVKTSGIIGSVKGDAYGTIAFRKEYIIYIRAI